MAVVYKGYNGAGNQAARIAGESGEMDAAAASVASQIRALAASHNVTGEYLNGIGTERIRGKRGVTDRLAFVDHEAAASIEFGHQQGYAPGFVGPRRYVEGLHILGRVAGVR